MTDLVEQRRDAYLEKMKKEDAEKVAKLLQRYPRNIWAAIELNSAVVIMRGEQEVMFFHEEKAAGAWMQHVYGCVPWAGKQQGVVYSKYNVTTKDGKLDTEWEAVSEKLTIKNIKDRGPKAGDLLIYLEKGDFYHCGIGLLDHSYGRDELAVTFDASGFRVGNGINNSGGPVPPVDPADLTYDGLRDAHYWRWWDGSGGGGKGGHYTITVPSWRWNGKRAEHHIVGKAPVMDATN